VFGSNSKEFLHVETKKEVDIDIFTVILNITAFHNKVFPDLSTPGIKISGTITIEEVKNSVSATLFVHLFNVGKALLSFVDKMFSFLGEMGVCI
jgi:hypothetical protein